MKMHNFSKKIILAMAALALLASYGPNKVDASTSKVKVSTNNQYKLTCDYWDESGELTWGNQEFIGNFYDADGYESNNSRACGETAKTRKYTYGNKAAGNAPLNTSIVYDSCNGTTGNQKAIVGQSCSRKGKSKLCAIKWAGYCYKDSTSAMADTKVINNKKFSVAKESVAVGKKTKLKNINMCAYIGVSDESVATYDEDKNVLKALNVGSTTINCYNENDNVIATTDFTVTDNSSNANIRYVNVRTVMFSNNDGTGSFTSLNRCNKVTYLNYKEDGYCKISYAGKKGYIYCQELNISEPSGCYNNGSR